MDSYNMPVATLASLLRYRDQHVETGGFLRAVLENDLTGAFKRADDDNTKALHDIVMWCYWELPSGAWGSPEAVRAWLAKARTA